MWILTSQHWHVVIEEVNSEKIEEQSLTTHRAQIQLVLDVLLLKNYQLELENVSFSLH